MLKLLLLLLLSALYGEICQACIIEGYPRYVRTERLTELSLNDTIKYSDCHKDIKKRFARLLVRSSGKVLHHHLKKILRDSEDVKILPRKIEFVDLEEALKNEYPLKKNLIFKNTRFTGGRQLYPYGYDDQLQIVCHNCQYPGKKSLEVRFFDSSSGKRKVIWGETHILTRTLSLVSLRTLKAGSSLKPSDFKEQFSYVMRESDSFFVNKSNLLFYKTNKVIGEGSVLRHSDLSSVNLVKMGKVTKTIVKKNGMKLMGVGIPLENGMLGKNIQLRGMDGKRIVVGKVIGFNKVEIDL